MDRCKRCNRELKSESSKLIGYGPTCYKKEFGLNMKTILNIKKVGGKNLEIWFMKEN